MNDTKLGFDAELRASPRPILAALTLLACLLYAGAEIFSGSWETVNRVISLSLIILGLSGGSWILVSWRPLVGRWSTLLSLLIAIYVTSVYLSSPEILTFAALPVALAVYLINLTASLTIAGGQTILLLLLVRHYPTALADVRVTLIWIWVTFATAYSMYRSIRRLIEWLEIYFERNQKIIEEARDHRMQLEKALQGFAHANRQLALANERASALRAIAESAERAKAAFVANVSHEFRTPLNMIIGLVDLMVESPGIYAVVLSDEMRKDLKVIHRNCEYLSEMIDDVLDLTRMEAGRFALHRERVDLSEIIDNSIAIVRPLLEKKRLEIHISVPADLPRVYCDRTRIQQVVLNLVSNAARFTEQGEIAVSATAHDNEVVVTVKDTGVGISPEDAERIFKPFEQGRLWHSKGGSGLGLGISKRFVELHGGRMWLRSKVGIGTTFYFTLPLARPIQHTARPGHAIKSDWVWHEPAFKASRISYNDQLLKPRVIVYDQVGTLGAWLDHYANGVEIVEAQTSDQIVEMLHQCPAHAVVVNDIDHVAVMQLAERIREQAKGTLIIGCAISHSAQSVPDDSIIGRLVKPVTRADLVSAVEAVGGPVRRILIVDDDPDVGRLFKRTLQAYDGTLEILTAYSGEEALDTLQRTQIDLMLLDIVMPSMNGWQVLTAVRENVQVSDVPTFLVSAKDPDSGPPTSDFLVVTISGGIPFSKVLRCSQELTSLLLGPEKAPDLMPV